MHSEAQRSELTGLEPVWKGKTDEEEEESTNIIEVLVIVKTANPLQ